MRIHIPGESTSMVTESTDVANNVVINLVPSMDADHDKQIDELKRRIATYILTWDGVLEGKGDSSKQLVTRKTPAEIAAIKIRGFLLDRNQ